MMSETSGQRMQLGVQPALDEYVEHLRSALHDVRPEAREELVQYALGEIELEAGLRYASAEDADQVRALLSRMGSPEDYAKRLRARVPVDQAEESAPASRLADCRSCRKEVSAEAQFCPHCGCPFPARRQWTGWGYEWKSKAKFRGWPLVHVAFGRDANGRIRVAKGVVAIGQFGFGGITIAQCGVGFVAGIGQFVIAPLAVGQIAIGLAALGQVGLGLLFGAGMVKTGLIATGIEGIREWLRSVLG